MRQAQDTYHLTGKKLDNACKNVSAQSLYPRSPNSMLSIARFLFGRYTNLSETYHPNINFVTGVGGCINTYLEFPSSCQVFILCLSDTMPSVLKSREEFIPRFRNAVRWLNANQKETLLELCANQKKRCREVLRLDGARTRF